MLSGGWVRRVDSEHRGYMVVGERGGIDMALDEAGKKKLLTTWLERYEALGDKLNDAQYGIDSNKALYEVLVGLARDTRRGDSHLQILEKEAKAAKAAVEKAEGALKKAKLEQKYVEVVIERLRDRNARAVYRRSQEKGRLVPDGLECRGNWIEVNFGRCFQLMKCDDA